MIIEKQFRAQRLYFIVSGDFVSLYYCPYSLPLRQEDPENPRSLGHPALSRLMGLLLAVITVQFMVSGIQQLQ
ncbi:MarC family protein [Thermodesulfobacteriota bacterium]